MLVQQKIVQLETVYLSCSDIAEAIESEAVGVCRAIISPDVAEFILENYNGHNRPERKGHTKFLSSQIGSNRFVFNGESICFGLDGTLGDGQHRLRGCVAADTPIEVLVVFGVSGDAFTTYDQGARRNGADVLSIEGEAQCHRLSACLRQIDNYFHGYLGSIDGSGNRDQLSDNAYVVELLEKYPEARRSVNYTARIGKLTRPSLAAAIHFLFSQRDASAADEFLDVVMEGVQLGRKYDRFIAEAADKLRSRLIENAMSNKKMSAAVVAALWCKAWNAARTGRIPRILSYRRDEGHIAIE